MIIITSAINQSVTPTTPQNVSEAKEMQYVSGNRVGVPSPNFGSYTRLEVFLNGVLQLQTAYSIENGEISITNRIFNNDDITFVFFK